MTFDLKTATLDDLFRRGDVNVHNVGTSLIIVDFKPYGPGSTPDTSWSLYEQGKFRGMGENLRTAIANLKPRFGKNSIL